MSQRRSIFWATITVVGCISWLLNVRPSRQLAPGGPKFWGVNQLKTSRRPSWPPNASSFFGPQQCNLEGVEAFPSGTEAWQQNAPSFLIAGAPKAGTTTLSALLKYHPTIFPPLTKELRLFSRLPIGDNETVSVREARTFLFESGGYRIESLKQHPQARSYDGTPSYLYYSSTLVPQILCVCPWIKIIVILRDPVERFYSAVRYEISRKSLPNDISLAAVVDGELKLLQTAGLNSTAQVPGSDEERFAWHRYQSLTRHGWIGKGVYDLQLRYLFKAFEDFGKPRSDLLVLSTSDLQDDIFAVYRRMLKFLNLHHAEIPFTGARNKGEHRPPLHPDIRRRLESFYGPYNARLNALLQETGLFFDDYHSQPPQGNDNFTDMAVKE